MRFSDVVHSPDQLMGVKAVWGGKSAEPVMCFGARGDVGENSTTQFAQARSAATKAVTSPYLLTIGGGAQASSDVQGRVLELVRVSGAYGKTTAFVRSPEIMAHLVQWPVAVMLTEVYAVDGSPHLIEDLGFPDRRVLTNAYDGVRSDADDISALWTALKDRTVTLRRDVLPPPGFIDPGKPQLCGTLYPKISASEGKKRYFEARGLERSSALAKEAKARNQRANNGVFVCEGCDFSDLSGAMFDAHHLIPICVGERESRVEHFAILCPTCHRWAHSKAPHVYSPVPIAELRSLRAANRDALHSSTLV
jgi:5-methylcytosine-specific restriction protein A